MKSEPPIYPFIRRLMPERALQLLCLIRVSPLRLMSFMVSNSLVSTQSDVTQRPRMLDVTSRRVCEIWPWGWAGCAACSGIPKVDRKRSNAQSALFVIHLARYLLPTDQNTTLSRGVRPRPVTVPQDPVVSRTPLGAFGKRQEEFLARKR